MSEDGACVWFAKYGGPDFWEAFSEQFYEKASACPSLRRFFCSMPKCRVKEIASDMWQVLLGLTGPMCALAIQEKHEKLNISEGEYQQYVRLMKETLFEMGVEAEDINEIEERLIDLEPLVCGQLASS